MLVFAGLGNPGPAYAQHRHNVGFMAVDVIHHAHGFSPWKARFQGVTAEGRLGTHKVVLLKPMTFMNESGRSVGEALRFFKLGPDALTVFHDELDLDPFRVKVKTGGGAAGQNGIRSISQHVTPDFRRVRIGIGHPGHKDRVTPHVLGNFAKTEERPLVETLADIADLAPILADGDDARFMSDLALRQQP
ncbi:aminoacyl-tRNA hydrolase [Sandaracinobacteroides hominis]|uniref:aminoacyl-tRNA hydrolase n=1 Tax=Sandaracinobacteroides hominis TaxID=2780086 RepID=UPI0018F6417A|nr:aminoacyl-tRNA hydrolase [Sandaracinobacteroides hominis]